MGCRGAVDIDFTVQLRDQDYHFGNFGGLLADPAIILAHALASITDSRRLIRIPEWGLAILQATYAAYWQSFHIVTMIVNGAKKH